MNFRVMIPTAGLGSRLGSKSKHINKALVTVGGKPAISHIIEKFDPSIEFVIALGYKPNSVKNFLTVAYPNRKFIFVEIENFEGEGSGLGLTLLECKEHLQLPFVFSSNDTIVLEDINPPTHNWMGFAETDNNSQYRSLRIKDRVVVDICPKGTDGDVSAYIGLCGIHDYKEFWSAMDGGVHAGSVEVGESFGLRQMLGLNVAAFQFTWFDTGNREALNKTKSHFSIANNYNILEKEEEAIWFVGDQVVKFSLDEEFISNRVLRAKTLKGFVPQITADAVGVYSYKKISGDVFSKAPTVSSFSFLMDWLTNFWNLETLDANEVLEFKESCARFYRIKTYERVKKYFLTFEQIDTDEIVNGVKMPKIFEMLEQIDWSWLCNGVASRFHGDLHFENILINQDSKMPFTLLDWRQDFSGNLNYGDIYYDFAKLNHGMIVCHELVNKELFEVERKSNNVYFDFNRKQNLVDCEKKFEEWIIENNYDHKKVRMLTAIVFLNIASLHHYPYSQLLFYLGKSMLHKEQGL